MSVNIDVFFSERNRPGSVPSVPSTPATEVPEVLNPIGSTPTTTYKQLGDTTDKNFIGKNGFVPVVVGENQLTLQPLPQVEQNGLISGGIVQWTGTGYVFNVSFAVYRIAGEPYTSDDDQVTLSTPDPTNDRIDVFAVDNTGSVVVIEGTPSGSPVKPQIDPSTQLELTSVIVTAASSVPTLTGEVIYDENTEWTGSSSGTGTANFASTNNPFQGTVSIETTNIQNGFQIVLDNGVDIDLSTYQTIGFQIDLKAALGAGQNISMTFLDSANNPISTALTFAFDKSSTVYQFVGIALSSLGLTSNNARKLRFRYVRTSGPTTFAGYFLDIIKLEGGINPPAQFGSFISLTDTPSTYSGQSGKVVAVKSDESGLEFITGGGGGTIGGTIAAGQIGYGSALDTLAGSNNLWWDNANTRIGIGTNAPSDTIDINGTARVRSVANATGNFVTLSATGVLQQRTASELATDIGAVVNTIQTVATTGTINDLARTGSTIIFTGGSAVTLNGLSAGTDGEEIRIVNYSSALLTIAHEAAGSTAANRIRGTVSLGRFGATSILKYRNTLARWVVITGWFLSDSTTGAYSNTNTGFGVDPLSNVRLQAAASTNTNASNALYCTDLAGNNAFQVKGSRECFAPVSLTVGTTATPLANVRLTLRGSGTGTNTNLRLEDSAGAFKLGFLDNGNIQLNITNGNIIGTATSQKLAFWNKTPIVQPTNAIAEATFVENLGGTAVNVDSTFGGYTLQQIAQALINLGLLA